MSGLRATPGVFEKVRHLPNLLSCICFPWQAARCGKIKLVGMLPVAGFRPLAAGLQHAFKQKAFFRLERSGLFNEQTPSIDERPETRSRKQE
jgi:hypothetical protein